MEEFSEVARKGRQWEEHLDQVLLTKPAEVVLEACQVLEKHGCYVEKELKSELFYSSTLCQVVFQALHYANLIVDSGTCTNCIDCFNALSPSPPFVENTHTHIHTHTHTHKP